MADPFAHPFGCYRADLFRLCFRVAGQASLAGWQQYLELYIRWMQEIRHFKPSTVSRHCSVAAGFCRTYVIDGILKHSPAERVRRPAVPSESPILGSTHLQFEALLIARPAQ